VSVPAALQLAVDAQGADVVVCVMGPGVVGTSSALGTTAVEMSAVLTWVAQLGGRPVPIVRASGGDRRDRHRGLSHHTRTALSLTPGSLGVPVPRGSELVETVASPHRAVEVEIADVATILAAASLNVTTMGRDVTQDRLFFDAVCAAATHAANLVNADGTVAAS
jgi:hypothetical protein